MSVANQETDDAFQPGQLGTRHLLGIITVAAVILGVTAARLRTLTQLEAGLVAGHWSVLLTTAAVVFYFGSWRRRRERAAAGQVLLQASCKPMTDRKRATIKWLLTALVVLDGITISLSLFPFSSLPRFPKTGVTTSHMVLAVVNGMRPQTAIWEGVLWAWCLSHWLTNVYRMEFCEHGILMHSGFCPWKGMSRLGWSAVFPNQLVFFQRGRAVHVVIDPGSRSAVEALLEKVRSGAPLSSETEAA